MASKKKTPKTASVAAKRTTTRKRSVRSAPAPAPAPAAEAAPASEPLPSSLRYFLEHTAIPRGFTNDTPVSAPELRRRMADCNLRSKVPLERLLVSVNRIRPDGRATEARRQEVRESEQALRPQGRRFHGAKLDLAWFPFPRLSSPCADRFGYLSSRQTRQATRLPFTPASQALLAQLGDMMGDPGREPNPASHDPADAGVSTIPAGFTYFGQFVDHDITLDVSSSLDESTDANTIHNMRSPSLDLDSVYGRGPGLDPFLYRFPTSGPSTAIRLQLGGNRPSGPGGPSGNGTPGGMNAQTEFDVPRVPGTLTAIIGDPRNDENLVVSQFHYAMLRFHNAVVDLLVAASFAGDIFAEAKRITTHHYQWAVVHDFLGRICGAAAVNDALARVDARVGSPFRMPVEFAVAAYRFGHSMVRDTYFVNHNFPEATLGQVFDFIRNPLLPVLSNWVVDFNAYFDTGRPSPTHNKARKIDSFMAAGLESLPGGTGLMALLATRNLRRGLAMGLPSGQGMAKEFGLAPMTAAQITAGLPAAEAAVLNGHGSLLLHKTPLWYYVLREAAVLNDGNQLGPVGARIVADTFVRMLRRDASSYLNVSGGFAPMLPSAVGGDFTVADLVNFAGVTQA